ncbi:serine/threonine-protein kinase [Streptomyces sp. NPDC101132]|uniref:serine/threonine-protein kinase n=1 Tax=Streptomyces sp. NPDC101132 TaxID=3366110 RepID=UPI0038029DF8
MALTITGCALAVRLVSLPLLLRTQRAFRQREGAASSGTPVAAAPDWAIPFLEGLLLLAGAGVLTALLPHTRWPVDLRGASVALWPENPLDLGTVAAEIANDHVSLYTNFAVAGVAGVALTVLLWFLTRRNLLTRGMPAGAWASPRTRVRVVCGFLGSAAALVVVTPVGLVFAALAFQAVAFGASLRHGAPDPDGAGPPAPERGVEVPSQGAPVPSVVPAGVPPVPVYAAPTSPVPDRHPGAGDAAAGEQPAGHRELHPYEPREIGEYRLLGRIGSGGMGTVYLARREGSATRVALKTLNPELLGNAELLRRFAREAEVLAMVSGAYTARVLDTGVAEGRPYLAMELLDGRPLDARLREEGPVRSPEALRALALALATALDAVHRRGLVHRDLKPANIMLTSAGPRLLDFGIAALVDGTRLTRTGASPGTLTYMAPEQFDGPPAGPAADVWAWACCVVAAAHGESPFAGTGIGAVYRRITETGPDPAATAAVRALAPALADVVQRALDTDPARRPADGAALLALLAPGPGHTTPDPGAVREEITRGWRTFSP